MKLKKLIPFLLSAVFLTGCTAPQSQANSYRQITMDEAVIMMEQEQGYVSMRCWNALLSSSIPRGQVIEGQGAATTISLQDEGL